MIILQKLYEMEKGMHKPHVMFHLAVLDTRFAFVCLEERENRCGDHTEEQNQFRSCFSVS